jgi:aminoglycoside 6'-N-acetyltransferase
MGGERPLIRLRRAMLKDLPILHHWDTQPHVIAATGDDDSFPWETELPRDVDWRELLIGEVGGRPVGVIQIIDAAREETHYWGDAEPNLRAIDIWIGEAADLGRGYGTAMMRLAIERCFAEPAVTAILIDPLARNTRAHRFYERLGFVAVGPRRFGTDDCMVYRLERDAWRDSRG